MTHGELRRILRLRWDWLPWRNMTPGQFVIRTMLGVCLGIAAQRLSDALHSLPAVHRNGTSAAKYDGYLGIVIDRTRTGWCDVHPSRLMFQKVNVGGVTQTIVFPLGTDALVWPVMGRATFTLLVAKIADIPPGSWQIIETQRQDCDWFDFITGGRLVVTNPVTVKIP